MKEASERNDIKGEVLGGQRKGIHWDWFAIIRALKMSNIRQYVGNREIIHAFVEASMSGDFDSTSLGIKLHDVASRVWDIAKEDTFSGVRFELGFALASRANPHSATKRTKVGEVFTLPSRKCNGRGPASSRRERI